MSDSHVCAVTFAFRCSLMTMEAWTRLGARPSARVLRCSLSTAEHQNLWTLSAYKQQYRTCSVWRIRLRAGHTNLQHSEKTQQNPTSIHNSWHTRTRRFIGFQSVSSLSDHPPSWMIRRPAFPGCSATASPRLDEGKSRALHLPYMLAEASVQTYLSKNCMTAGFNLGTLSSVCRPLPGDPRTPSQCDDAHRSA